MDFTTEQIKERLDVLVGEVNDHYKISEIMNKIFVEALGVEPAAIWSHYSWSTSNTYHQTLYFNWKGYGAVRVEYKKKKGERHWNWYSGSSTDYTFKSFEVFFYDENKTLLEAIDNCNNLSEKSKKAQNENYNLAKKIYKHIKETFAKELKGFSMHSLLDKMSREQWRIERELKEEDGGE